MAKNKDTLKPNKEKTVDKAASFISKNRIILIVLVSVVFAGVIAFAVYKSVEASNTSKALSVIDSAEYALKNNTAALSDAELQPYYDNALEDVKPYVTKGGIVGARAEMLTGEVQLRKNNNEAARDAYLSAAKKAGKSYLSGICYFNAAVACEEMNDNEKAIEYYTIAANDKEFADPTHAWFSVGRLKEVTLDYLGAKDAYLEVVSRNNPQDPWFNYSKDRLLQMQIDGKTE